MATHTSPGSLGRPQAGTAGKTDVYVCIFIERKERSGFQSMSSTRHFPVNFPHFVIGWQQVF